MSIPNKKTLLSMVAALSPSFGLGSAAPVFQPPKFVSKSSVESKEDPSHPPLTRRIFNTIDNTASILHFNILI